MKKQSDNKKIKTKEKPIDKNPVGRPTKYLPSYNDIAKKLIEKGYIDKEVYEILGVSEVIGISWKKKYPEFAKSVSEAKKKFDSNKIIEGKLKKLAMGFEFDSEEIVIVSDGSQIGSHWERVPVKKVVHPNLGAIKEWLHNRDSTRWKERQLLEVTNPDGEPFKIEIK